MKQGGFVRHNIRVVSYFLRKDVSDHRKELSFRPILKIHDNKNIAVYFAINMNSFINDLRRQMINDRLMSE
jgi:hypothetical protein